jgi:hypothetical protein
VSKLKTCSKCGESKALSEFKKRKDAPDGHEGRCKACAGSVKRTWSTANKERLQQSNKDSRAKTRQAWDRADTIVCNRCGQEKPKDQYYPGKWICKECNRAWRVGQWKHEIKLAEKGRRKKGMKAQTILPWCSTCPSCSVPHRFKTPEQCATWQWRRFLKSIATRGWIEAYEAGKKEMNRVRSVLWYRARYATQPEIERERVRQYKYANPDKVQQWGDLRWQRIANSTDGTINKTELSVILNEHKTCPYCGKKLMESNKVLDHMEPVARGGTHSVSNLVVCCSACNMRKNAMPWAQWVEHLPPKYQARAERIWERRKCYQLSLMNIQ